MWCGLGLRLAAISLQLMQVYRDGDLTLEQLTAFAITEDHTRQEAEFDRLTYNRDASTIRRMLTETHVPATERRARFVGLEDYMEAGGTLLRDLFSEDRGGDLEDVALLDLLVTAKLGREADRLREAEGWKWARACLDFPHAHGMRRVYPHPVELSGEDQAALDAARSEVDQLADWLQTADELPDHVDGRLCELEADIDRLEAKRHAYDPDDIARGGAFVVLNYGGEVRIERGFIRPEDEKPRTDAAGAADASAVNDGEAGGDPGGAGQGGRRKRWQRRGGRPPALRHPCPRPEGSPHPRAQAQLSEQPDVAIIALTHALSAQVFYVGADVHLVGHSTGQDRLGGHAVGIEDTPAGKAWADRHANWARQMPRDVTALWAFVAELDHDSRLALLAHCVALTVNAVKLPWDKRPRALATADRLAEAVALDMAGYWRSTARSYLGRVTKARILDALREGASAEAAERMADMKKVEIAEAAEQLLAGTGWLPALLRTPRSDLERKVAVGDQGSDAYPQAAE